MNKFYEAKANPEYRSKRKELLKQIDLFHSQFSVLKRLTKSRNESIKLINEK
jgi:hypothetical protein